MKKLSSSLFKPFTPAIVKTLEGRKSYGLVPFAPRVCVIPGCVGRVPSDSTPDGLRGLTVFEPRFQLSFGTSRRIEAPTRCVIRPLRKKVRPPLQGCADSPGRRPPRHHLYRRTPPRMISGSGPPRRASASASPIPTSTRRRSDACSSPLMQLSTWFQETSRAASRTASCGVILLARFDDHVGRVFRPPLGYWPPWVAPITSTAMPTPRRQGGRS
jgi:hypothetical protein